MLLMNKSNTIIYLYQSTLLMNTSISVVYLFSHRYVAATHRVSSSYVNYYDKLQACDIFIHNYLFHATFINKKYYFIF
jgi:hypothetical protein